MNFKSIHRHFSWVRYEGQEDKNVTYVFVFKKPNGRLRGCSDILYIGKTKQPIKKRYKQETRTNNTSGNTQQTNIRMTHVFSKIGLDNNIKCYYVRKLDHTIAGNEKGNFLTQCKTWDKKFYIGLNKRGIEQKLKIPLEKFLIVSYASEHLEAPPMNNRM